MLPPYKALARAVLFSALAGVFAIALTAHPVCAWTQDKFILGMWGDPCVTTPFAAHRELNESRHRLARDAHFNLLQGSNLYGELARSDSVLDLCADNGLSALVQLPLNVRDPKTFDPRAKGFDRNAYAKGMADRAHFLPGKIAARRRAHFYGYFLGDEPPQAPNYVAFKNVLQSCKAYDAGALVYFNLLPDFCFLKHEEFEAYAESLTNDPNPARRPDVVSYDYYPFLESGMRPTYFYGLSVYRRLAGERPLWACPQTTAFGDYLDPTPASIRFLSNCPIAYGAKGLTHFTYNISPPNPNPEKFRTGPIVNCDTVTPMYDVVKNMNFYLEQVVGPVVMSSRLLGTYHAAVYPAGQVIPADEVLGSRRAGVIAKLSGTEILCGVFDSSAGTYLWVVNKDIKKSRSAGISLSGDRAGRVTIGPAEVGYAGGTSYQPLPATYDAGHQLTELASVTLAPGEGRMIRISH